MSGFSGWTGTSSCSTGRGLDHLADPGDLFGLVGSQGQPHLIGIGNDIEHATIGHIDTHLAELGHIHLGIQMDGETRERFRTSLV